MKIGVFLHNRDFFGAKLIHIPLLYSIHKKYDKCEITVYTPYKNNAIFMETGLVKDVIYYEFNILNMILELRRKKFDVIISLRPTALWLNLAISLSGAKTRIGFKNSISFLSNTETKIYRRDIYRAVDFNNIIDNNLPLNYYFKNFPAKKLDKRNIFIIPGGGGDYKRWNIENFLNVCEKLKNNDTSFFFVLGKMEEGYIHLINKFLKTNNGEILFNRSFKELVSYFHSGDIFISNDTGAVHIAQMMDKRCVILYSSEFQNFERVIGEWFLKSDKSRFIVSEKGKNINAISPEDVVKIVREVLNKQ